MKRISSAGNLFIKELKELKDSRVRKNRQLFFIEGTRFVKEALCSDYIFYCIVVSQSFYDNNGLIIDKSNLEIIDCDKYILADSLFKSVSDTENPQGIMAVVRIKTFLPENIIKRNNSIIMLDNVRDPGNMGTIIRTADAFSFAGVFLSPGCVDVYNPKVQRAAAGAIFHLPVCPEVNITEMISILNRSNYSIIGTDIKASLYCNEIEFPCNTAIIIGNEASGISNEILEAINLKVKIPMPGSAESLNASTAASIIMYEIMRQNIKK